MPADVESQLRELGGWFRSELAHVDPDEITDGTPDDLAVDDGTWIDLEEPAHVARRRRWLVAATAAVTVLALVGVIATTRGSDSNSEPTALGTDEPGPAGAMLLPTSSGMTVAQLQTGAIAGNVAMRWYATAGDLPETRTYLRVMTVPQQWPTEGPPSCATPVSDADEVTLADGTTACLDVREASDPFGTISVRRPSAEVIIAGRATDEQLRTAAATVVEASNGPGYEIRPARLPPDVALTGIGWNLSDFATISLDDASGPLVQVGWEAADGTSMFYAASRGDFLANDRLGFDTITDITVRGQPGFIRTLAAEPDYVGVVWQENDMTYQVGSQGLGTERVLALIEQLQPATHTEWDALVATSGTTVQDPWADGAALRIYLRHGSSSSEVDAIRQLLEAHGDVIDLTRLAYLDEAQTLDLARVEFADDPATLDILEATGTPSRLNVFAAPGVADDAVRKLIEQLDIKALPTIAFIATPST
ncbi:MAG: hypothetical protein U0Q03_19275 [Acidimicrobiales bacterium]